MAPQSISINENIEQCFETLYVTWYLDNTRWNVLLDISFLYYIGLDISLYIRILYQIASYIYMCTFVHLISFLVMSYPFRLVICLFVRTLDQKWKQYFTKTKLNKIKQNKTEHNYNIPIKQIKGHANEGMSTNKQQSKIQAYYTQIKC